MPKVVQCPKCRSRLQEPPEGTPLYRCGSCSTTLQASHATQEDLDARRRRSSEKRETSSVSDSSSGEISDRVTDEFTVTRNSNVSAPYKWKDTSTLAVTDEEKSSTDTVPTEESHERNPPVTSTYQQLPVPAQERIIEPYSHPVDTLEKGMKQLTAESVSGADYLQRGAVPEEIGAVERWSSNSNLQHGNSILQGHRGQGFSRGSDTSASQYTRSGFRTGGTGASSFRTSQSFMNGSPAGAFTQPPQFTHSRSVSSDASGQNHLNFGGQRTNSNNTPKYPVRASSKLRWEARDDSDSASVAPSSDAMMTTTGEDERMSFEEVKLPVSVKEATSVEYSEKNRKPLGSRRRSPLDDRRAVSEAGGDYISGTRTPSEGSEKAFDMYDHPASVGDYEPSETSSTMDDVDPSEGYVLRRHLEEIGQYSPPRDHGLSRQGSRPNASSGRSVFSEESSSYGSQTEMMSPDNYVDNAREYAVGRRNSWDERISRMGSVAPSNPGLGRPMSVRQKSVSHYGNIPTERLHRGSSDPGGSYKDVEREREKLLVNHAQPQEQLPKPNYQPQPGLNNRYINSALAAQRSPRGPWSPVNASSRPYYPDPLHASQTRPPFPTRPGQTKQGHPPPLPPSGTLPHVICQHCEVLLSVPDNLPPPKSNIQKLRCGSCRKISLFSVPHAQSEESNELVVPYYSRADPPAGNSLLVSSPDHHAELSSSSTSHEVTGRHGRIPLPRARSVGDDDKGTADQEVADRARLRKADLSSDVSGSHSPPDIPSRNAVGVSGSNAPLYRPTGGLDPRSHVTDTMAVPHGIPQAGGNGAAEDKRIQDGGLTSSDSEAEFAHRTSSVGGSPRISHSSSRSPPDPSSTGQEDLTSSALSTTGRAGTDPHEARGLRKSMKGMFGIRKSVLELTKTGRQASGHFRRKVVVNGQAIPDHLVKKAEEQAGPIHPGSYWYDSQAGFWGVAGTHCLGIIPPFIEEFNSPLSKDCSSGKTGIQVNGRELHHQDLRKLSQRGLPDAPGMAYRIEIDGRVIEEAMGSELRSLGRLAPSVEQKGRGSGMYVPAHP